MMRAVNRTNPVEPRRRTKTVPVVGFTTTLALSFGASTGGAGGALLTNVWKKKSTSVPGVVTQGVAASGALDRFELSTVDTRFAIRATEAERNDVVVAIDDATFNRLGVRWPFARSVHARAIRQLRRAGARVIAYDVQFTEPTSPAEDNALISAVTEAGNVILATTETGPSGESNVLGGDDVVRSANAHAANALFVPDRDGVIRHLRQSIGGLVSFPVAGANLAIGRSATARVVPGDHGWIDFRGPPGSVSTVSFSSLTEGKVPASVFRDKVVILGATAPTLQDIRATATTGEQLMAGPEIQANAVSTALRGLPLRDASRWDGPSLIVCLGLLTALIGLRFGVAVALTLTLFLAAGYVAFTQFAFNRGVVMPLTYPVLAAMLAGVGVLAANYGIEAFERAQVRDAFARFVPESVVDEVLAQASGRPWLEGVEMVGTVMFVDLRGFTTYVDGTPPAETVRVLNRYLDEFATAVLAEQGTVVSYVGDGLMAVFGAPVEQTDHADRGLRAALDILEIRNPAANALHHEQGGAAGSSSESASNPARSSYAGSPPRSTSGLSPSTSDRAAPLADPAARVTRALPTHRSAGSGQD